MHESLEGDVMSSKREKSDAERLAEISNLGSYLTEQIRNPFLNPSDKDLDEIQKKIDKLSREK